MTRDEVLAEQLMEAFAECVDLGRFDLAERYLTLAFGLFSGRRAGWVNEGRTQ
jgi:hypothetical protein